MRQFFRFVTAHPVPVLAVGGVVALTLAICMFWLRRDTSPDAFIPPSHPALVLKGEVEEAFGLTEPIAVGVIRDRDAPDGIFCTSSLRLICRLTEAIRELPEVDAREVLSLATVSGVYFRGRESGFERILQEVPKSREEIDAMRKDVLGYELYRGTLVAEDGSAACILIRPKSEAEADRVYRAVDELLRKKEFRDGEHQLVVAGEAAVRSHMGTAVSDDAMRMNFICPLVMFLLISLAYRTWRGLILPMCVIGGAAASALGLMAVSGVPIYIVTNGIFVVIMAVGVADSLHLLGQYYEEQLRPDGRTKQEIIVDACMALWFPVLITSLTDVAGFFSLYLVGIMPPIRYFGLFTCVGVLGALVYSYTMIPAGLSVLPLQTSRAFAQTRPGDGPRKLDFAAVAMGRIGTFVYRRRREVLLLGAILIALALYGASKMYVNDARILAFKSDHPIVHAANALNERFDGTSHLNIVLTPRDESETGLFLRPEILRQVDDLETYAETLDYVGGTHSLAGWVKRAHEKANEGDSEFYAIPDDAEETKFYLDALSSDVPDDRPGMAELLGEIVDPTYTKTNLVVRLKSSQYIHQSPVIESLQAYLDEHFSDDGPLHAQLAGRANLDYHWVRIILTSHIRSVCLAFACVLLLTGLMFRSVAAGLLCTMTVGTAVLAIYAMMGFGDIPLGVGTSMFASIAIGAGVNFPIHIIDRLRTRLSDPNVDAADVFRDTFTFTGRALLFTALVLAGGFLLLCVSEFRTLVRFGLLIRVGMMVSFLTSVTLLPALLAVWRPRFLYTGGWLGSSREERATSPQLQTIWGLPARSSQSDPSHPQQDRLQ